MSEQEQEGRNVKAEVRGEQRAGESREAQFTHMVLVSGLPLRTTRSGTNFTFHSLKAFLRHFCPPLKGHVQSFHKWITHTVQLKLYIRKQEEQWNSNKRRSIVVYIEK